MQTKRFMKPFLLLIILSGLTTLGVAQSVSGLYKNGNESLIFRGDSLDFDWKYGCCLITEFKGKAKWENENGKIFIRMKNATHSNTIISSKNTIKDSFQISVITDSGEMINPTIKFFSKGKLMWGAASNGNSFVIKKNLINKLDSAVIDAAGYQTQSFSFQIENDYTVHMFTGVNNEAYTMIFGEGKGLKMKSKKNILLIKRPMFIDHKNVMHWVKYEKA
jgi:hypothetical protein